jgi:hypothetical protein
MFKTQKDFEQLFLVNSIPSDKVCAEKVFKLKKTLDILFFDKITFAAVAYISKGSSDIMLMTDIAEEMMKMKSINVSHKIESNNVKLSIDGILDKINHSGINSLSNQEKAFLAKASK